MTKRLQELARRKAALINRCAHEREEIARLSNQIRSNLSLGSMVRGLGKSLSSHPMIAAGISALLASGYAAKTIKSAGAVLNLWRLAQPLWSLRSKRGSRA